MISLQNVVISIDQIEMFKIQKANLQKGKIVILVGRNGVGKTTLLKTILGLHQNYVGDVQINDVRLSSIQMSQRAKLLSGLLSTDRFFNAAKVFDIISYGRLPYLAFDSSLKASDLEVINNAMNSMRLGPWCEKDFDTLSDGLKQRVLLAKNVAQQTQYWLLDEPFNFLDLPSKNELIQFLKSFARLENKGILMSSHDEQLMRSNEFERWVIHNGLLTVIEEGQELDLGLYGLI